MVITSSAVLVQGTSTADDVMLVLYWKRKSTITN